MMKKFKKPIEFSLLFIFLIGISLFIGKTFLDNISKENKDYIFYETYDVEYDKTITSEVRSAADRYMIQQIGQQNFDRYITFAGGLFSQYGSCPNLYENNCPHYTVDYRIHPDGDKSTTGYIIQLFLAPDGSNPYPQAQRVPNCVEVPDKCAFADMNKIQDTAEQNASSLGKKPWNFRFVLDYRGFYTWIVFSAVNSLSPGTCIEYNELIINANSGSLLDIKKTGVCS